jgi:hypothetical protein
MGEKFQSGGLKFFNEIEKNIARKVEKLIEIGYEKVYLISDHGFVLTGILEESDKISVELSGRRAKSERYIRTVDKQNLDSNIFVEIAQKKEEFNYLYFSKTIQPFKTPSVYGFSHGGISPQELITPYICWSSKVLDLNTLKVFVGNKEELLDIMGEHFKIMLCAKEENSNGGFVSDRKVYILFFNNGNQVRKSDIITIQPGESISREFSFDGHDEYDVQILEYGTNRNLDSVKVKKSNKRDLGGLF